MPETFSYPAAEPSHEDIARRAKCAPSNVSPS
jgi:hypothetical protein